MYNVELAAMAVQNVIGKEKIMSIAPISAYLVYDDFRQYIITSLIYERL